MVLVNRDLIRIHMKSSMNSILSMIIVADSTLMSHWLALSVENSSPNQMNTQP